MNKIMVGACQFCGQIKNIEAEEELEQEEVNRLVTMQCDCEAARAYQASVNRVKKADNKVDVLFGVLAPEPVSEKVIEIMKLAVRACEAESMVGININIDGSTKAKITKTSKNTLKVERTDTTVQTLED